MGKLKLGTAYRVCDACSTPLAPLGSERAAADALLCDACMGTYRRLVAEVTRPVLRWHGGKFLLAPWVISHFPKHRIYVEPFGGAASVLLQKPRSYGEVYNDLNGDVVNLFQVLRDPELALTLANMLRLTPFSRVEFKLSYVPADCQVERARRLVVRCFQGFGSAAHNATHATGFRANSRRSGTTPAQDWAHYPDALPAIVARLQGVVIEHRPASEVIAQHDTPDTLFYCDPPYVHDARKPRQQANYGPLEMTDADHEALATQLHGVKGMVVLSGYDCDLYARLFPGWDKRTRQAFADGAQPRTEVLWLNPAAQARTKEQWLFS